jgi:hypothetical protein
MEDIEMNTNMVSIFFFLILLLLALYCSVILTIRRFLKLKSSIGKVLNLGSSTDYSYNPTSYLLTRKEYYTVMMEVEGKCKRFISGQGIHDSLKTGELIQIRYHRNRIIDYKRLTVANT